MALDHNCQVQRHSHAERGHDAYMTPPRATEALLRIEKDLPRRIWEPACGDGTGILDVLRIAGHEVIGSNIGNYDRPDCFWHRDFLAETKMPACCTTIVTNPPYNLCAGDAPFVRHALNLADTAAHALFARRPRSRRSGADCDRVNFRNFRSCGEGAAEGANLFGKHNLTGDPMNQVAKFNKPRLIPPGSVILKCVDGHWKDRDGLT